MIESQEIKPGDIVFYVLRRKDKPVEPERKWKGRILCISASYATVKVLEKGYEREEETIFVKQIVQVATTGEKADGSETHEQEAG
jgi:hypothetical protein